MPVSPYLFIGYMPEISIWIYARNISISLSIYRKYARNIMISMLPSTTGSILNLTALEGQVLLSKQSKRKYRGGRSREGVALFLAVSVAT